MSDLGSRIEANYILHIKCQSSPFDFSRTTWHDFHLFFSKKKHSEYLVELRPQSTAQ